MRFPVFCILSDYSPRPLLFLTALLILQRIGDFKWISQQSTHREHGPPGPILPYLKVTQALFPREGRWLWVAPGRWG